MANFGPKPWVNLPWKNLNFSTFWTSCFYSLERRVFILEYRKTDFPALYSLKTKGGKMANFKAEPWVNPFAKIAIFSTFWTSCFYSLEGRLFVLEYRKTNFSCSIMPKKKKKDWEMANFGPKPWVNPRWKNLNFSTFWTSCFYSL